MKKLFLLTIILFFSCNNQNENDIYKTKSGEYGSKVGNFVIKFISEPNFSIVNNENTAPIYRYRATLGVNKIFTLEYFDYADDVLNQVGIEAVYNQIINNVISNFGDNVVDKNVSIVNQHGLEGKHFVVYFKDEVKGYVDGKIFLNGNRVYIITYMGKHDKNIDPFMKSFRLIKM